MTIIATDVAKWLASPAGGNVPEPTGDDLELLERVVAAVIVHVAHVHPEPAGGAADYDQAVLMQSARIWSRRHTPSGVAGFGEFGAVRVTRLDPDVAELLAPYRTFPFS